MKAGLVLVQLKIYGGNLKNNFKMAHGKTESCNTDMFTIISESWNQLDGKYSFFY